MKADSPRRARYVRIGRSHFGEPIRVKWTDYKRFRRQIDRQLQQLVEQWMPWAAPNASRSRGSLDGLWSHLEQK